MCHSRRARLQRPLCAEPVGSFAPNAFGLHDMIGNMFEWVEDCWSDSYQGAPTDGSARRDGDCGAREMRGGSWFTVAGVRAASLPQSASSTTIAASSVGFRIVQGNSRNEHAYRVCEHRLTVSCLRYGGGLREPAADDRARAPRPRADRRARHARTSEGYLLARGAAGRGGYTPSRSKARGRHDPRRS